MYVGFQPSSALKRDHNLANLSLFLAGDSNSGVGEANSSAPNAVPTSFTPSLILQKSAAPWDPYAGASSSDHQGAPIAGGSGQVQSSARSNSTPSSSNGIQPRRVESGPGWQSDSYVGILGSQTLARLADGFSSAQQAGNEAAYLEQQRQIFVIDQQDRVLVNVRALAEEIPGEDGRVIDQVDQLRQGLGELGFVENSGSELHGVVTGYLPIGAISHLPTVAGYSAVTPVYAPKFLAGSVTTEGDAIIGANTFRHREGVDGTGVTVGVISDSVGQIGGGLADSQATGDLPGSVQVLKDGPAGSSDEGRSILEVIHDVAPGANLAFSTGAEGPHAMADAMLRLARDGQAGVIIDDVRYPNEPFFNDGLLAQTVDTVAINHDVTYISAAGNFGTRGWESAYKSSQASIGGVQGLFAQISGTESQPDLLQDFQLAPGQSLDMVFQWDSAFIEGGSNYGRFQVANQYDVLVTDKSGTRIFAVFNDVTMNTDEALQRVLFLNDGSFGTNEFALAFRHVAGPDASRLKWVRFDENLAAQGQGASTVFGHAAAMNAVAVAAVGANDPTVAREYSSRGGVSIHFNEKGERLESPQQRQKPDLAAPDGVSVSFAPGGTTTFAGTSAAAAHVAGNAALLRQKAVEEGYWATVSTLIQKSQDLGPTGWDAETGFGLDPAGAPPRAIPINSQSWTQIGPAPINPSGNPGGTASSGRITGVAAHPTNANILYAATAGGGVWKTTNGGNSWLPLTDTQRSLFMGSIAVSRTNPNIIYAGMGEGTNSGLSFAGQGLLKSTNAGQSWQTITNANAFVRKAISQIAISSNPNTVYIAVSGGVNGVGGGNGIYKTTNGGTSWTLMSGTIPNVNGTEQFSDVVVHPSNPNIVYCAIGSPGGDAANGVYVSTDGGTNWSAGNFPTGTANGNIKIALSRSNPTIVVASVADTNGDLRNIYQTTNSGANWAALSTQPGNFMNGIGWYANAVAISPTNPNIIYVGGLTVLTTQDGGATAWTNITTGANGNGVHVDQHAMSFDANNRLIIGNDGGAYRLNNNTLGSITWGNLNNTLATLQFIGGDVHPTNPNIAYGGTQDNGTLRFNGSRLWREIRGGDGSFAWVDFRNPNTIYVSTQRTGVESSFLARSDNQGGSFTNITTGIATTDPSLFYPPYVMDPSNSSRLILGTDRLYVTTNRGGTWTTISTPNQSGWDTGANVTSIAIARTNGRFIYAATANSRIYVTQNNGTTWTQRSITGASGIIYGLLVDPNNPNIAYATLERYGGGRVYRTTNAGQTWTDISSNLPNVPTYSLAYNSRTRMLWVGTDRGVYATTNNGGSWARYGASLPNVQARWLVYNQRLNTLSVFTHGRSAWQIQPTGGGGG
ncbi:MAG: S8 family serine peptidase, partial [Gemmataceae bacterium]